MAKDVSTAKIADNTEGFSGSDLRQLCTAAAMCSIRELMKATSKASKDKAAAKKVKRTGAVVDSNKIGGAGAGTRDGPSQQQDTSDTASGDREQSTPAPHATDGNSSIAADEPSVSSTGAAADTAKQTKQGIGSKRDMDEDSSSSSITKRLKASTDSLEGAGKTDTQGGSAGDVKLEETDGAGTTNGAASSTHANSPSRADANLSVPTSQKLGHHEQQHAEASTQSRSQSVAWLLSKYKEVATAADQQVCIADAV